MFFLATVHKLTFIGNTREKLNCVSESCKPHHWILATTISSHTTHIMFAENAHRDQQSSRQLQTSKSKDFLHGWFPFFLLVFLESFPIYFGLLFILQASLFNQLIQRVAKKLFSEKQQPIRALCSSCQIGRQFGNLVPRKPIGFQEGLQALFVLYRDRYGEALIVFHKLRVDILSVKSLHPNHIGRSREPFFPFREDFGGGPLFCFGIESVAQTFPNQRVDF